LKVFGGFASHSWRKTSNGFYGDEKCFLFQLEPVFRSWHTTKLDKNYMYVDENGMGMGGSEYVL
jgi:hypothetical protein